ncbi:MAG: hypothetical protein H7Z75_05535 [Ferruginibacter sp.]|nr:hypothetical protein [Cytophagales bacterium]
MTASKGGISRKRRSKLVLEPLPSNTDPVLPKISEAQVDQDIRDSVKLSSDDYPKKFLGLKRGKRINLENTSSYFLDSIIVRIAYSANNEKIKTERMVFTHIEPRSSRRIDASTDSRRKNISFTIETVHPKLPPILKR